MSKRRITLSLDDDVVESLRSLPGASVSAIANDTLRQALQRAADRAALLGWLDELDARYGAPEERELRAADEVLDRAERGESTGEVSAA